MDFERMRRLGGWGPLVLGIFSCAFSCGLLSGCQGDGNDDAQDGAGNEANGWKGTIEVHQRGRERAPLLVGSLLARNSGPMLFNIAVKAHEVSVTLDPKAHLSFIVMHSLRKYLKSAVEEIEGSSLYQCAPPLIYACLEKRRYVKVGEEKVEGHPCEIYEGHTLYKGQLGTERIWHPTDLPTVYWVKATAVISAALVIEASLKDIAPQKLEFALFKVPDGYQKLEMPGMPPF